MRCACKVCSRDVWMVQAESAALGCVCPECGYRCSDCLGTDTVVSRDRISALARDPRFSPEHLAEVFSSSEEDFPVPGGPEDADWIERYGGF